MSNFQQGTVYLFSKGTYILKTFAGLDTVQDFLSKLGIKLIGNKHALLIDT